MNLLQEKVQIQSEFNVREVWSATTTRQKLLYLRRHLPLKLLSISEETKFHFKKIEINFVIRKILKFYSKRPNFGQQQNITRSFVLQTMQPNITHSFVLQTIVYINTSNLHLSPTTDRFSSESTKNQEGGFIYNW